MKDQLSIGQIFLAVLVVIISGLVFIIFGWYAFSTLTERPGLYGDMHYYYRIYEIVFGLYKLFIAAVALLAIGRLSFFVYKRNKNKVSRTLIHVAIFFALLLLCEIYLSSRFVPNG